MSDRPLHDPARTTPAVREKMANNHRETIDEIRQALARHEVVVVGMAWNPHVPKARAALTEAGIEHHYLEYGNYLTGWKQRLAIKLWSGWGTFPQVFVRTVLVGGNVDLRKALADGSLEHLRRGEGAAG
jgi:monothiol glutaredoxin